MDFLKAAAQAAQEQVNELKMGALELAEDLSVYTDSMTKGAEGNKDLEFAEGALGFRLEGTIVVSVDPSSQAELLGVEAGDRLAAVAGYAVPDFDPDDVEAEQRAMKMVKQWLKEMPRPSTLTFVPLASPEEDFEVPAVSSSSLGAPLAAGSAAEGPRPSPRGSSLAAAGDAEGDGGAGAAGGAEGSPEPPAATSGSTSESMQVLLRLAAEWQQESSGLEAALPADLQALQAELQREQEERKQLVSELQRAKHTSAKATASLDALKSSHQKKVAELQAQLTAAREEGRKALLAASAGEADSFTAVEASEARQQVLEEEVARLRQALDTAGQTAAEGAAQRVIEVEELTVRATSAEARAASAAQRGEAFARELRGFCEAHEAEVELLRGERAELERQHARHLAEQERKLEQHREKFEQELVAARSEAEAARRRIEEAEARTSAAKGEAAAAALEAAASRMEAAAAASPFTPAVKDISLDDDEEAPLSLPRADSEDASELQGRIEMLERRCSTLQKKLNARPVIFQNPQGAEMDDSELAGGSRRPSWELGIVSIAGPRAGALAVLLYVAVDETLRSFTRRLLKRDAWLWMFYAHLVLLYAIAASSYAEIAPLSDGSTADIQLKQQSSPSRSGAN